MLLNILLLLVGFVVLIKGADFFVDGSSSVARAFHVPGLIIGLTIVAMGTSAPELAVSVSAALSGSNEIAVSNVVGSNIFNLLVVLGICAIMSPLPVDSGILKRDFPVSIAATLAVILMAAAGVLSRFEGVAVVAVFLVYLAITIYMSKKMGGPEEEEQKILPAWKSILFILGGLAGIIGGGQLVVNCAKSLAFSWGMSETLVGLTIVAVGTSLPELVTSLVASKKGENGMAIGNVVGSNIFNLLLILGVSAAVHPIAVTMESIVDLVLLLIVTAIFYVFVCTGRKISRAEGVIAVAMYVGYMIFAIVR